MLLITLTNLYPNQVQIRHGVFVRERLKHFLASTELPGITPVVIAPIPWMPFSLRASLARLKAVPRSTRDEALDCDVYHPRYLSLPLLGNVLAPLFYALSVWPILRKLARDRHDVVIDAHFGFPDSAAAVLLGKLLGAPVVATQRGSDLNKMADEIGIRQWLQWALGSARVVVAVSAALAQRAREVVADISQLEVVRNGVDGNVFRITDCTSRLRTELQLHRPTLLSVGNLVPLKGHDLVIEALENLPDYELLIVGAGPQEARLHELVITHNCQDRVRFIGEVPQRDLVQYYQAADVLVLASSREGLPNVVLEALSCGTPVIATDVGGVGEVVKHTCQGELLRERSAHAISAAVMRLNLAQEQDEKEAIRASVAEFEWASTVRQLDDIFKTILPTESENLDRT